MAHFHFIGGEKGGVGKSLVARLLAQYLIDHEQPFLGFDTDRSHGALMRFYAVTPRPSWSTNTKASTHHRSAVAEPAVDGTQRCILVDLAAQTRMR